jgi:hypothetical protein
MYQQQQKLLLDLVLFNKLDIIIEKFTFDNEKKYPFMPKVIKENKDYEIDWRKYHIIISIR